jgi:hypothetical protein
MKIFLVSRQSFLVFLAASIIVFALFRVLNAPLITVAAPSGIVSFELARAAQPAQAMIDSWDANARLFAAFGLGFDYLFMLTYASAIAIGALLAAGRHSGWFNALGQWIVSGAVIAAICDAIENLGLAIMLFNGASDPWALIAWACAMIKFALIAIGILYGVIGAIAPVRSSEGSEV